MKDYPKDLIVFHVKQLGDYFISRLGIIPLGGISPIKAGQTLIKTLQRIESNVIRVGLKKDG